MPGPVDQKAAGKAAARAGNVGPFASGEKYSAALDEVKTLQSMLETLASRDSNKMMTSGIEKPAAAKPGPTISNAAALSSPRSMQLPSQHVEYPDFVAAHCSEALF
jgi:hypothetical protein